MSRPELPTGARHAASRRSRSRMSTSSPARWPGKGRVLPFGSPSRASKSPTARSASAARAAEPALLPMAIAS
jgi:hypothetical protein